MFVAVNGSVDPTGRKTAGRHPHRAGAFPILLPADDLHPAQSVVDWCQVVGAVLFAMTEIRSVSTSRVSAGLLMYRLRDGQLQVLLAHPGGPFFKNKDDGVWSIPKGELESDEDFLEAATREFKEEVRVAPAGPFIALTPIKQKGGKIVHAWAFKGDCNPSKCVSNIFTMEWPPKSGRQVEFPESDRVDFFDVDTAKRKIKDRQVALIDELETILSQ